LVVSSSGTRANCTATLLLPPIGPSNTRLEGIFTPVLVSVRGTRDTVAGDANTRFPSSSSKKRKKSGGIRTEAASCEPNPTSNPGPGRDRSPRGAPRGTHCSSDRIWDRDLGKGASACACGERASGASSSCASASSCGAS
jgi:hypothetical protein